MTLKVNYGYFSGVGGIAGNNNIYELLLNTIITDIYFK